MSVALPIRSHPSHAEDSYSREEVISVIQDFYELLIKLPYIPPTALLLPPKEGWSGVNVQELRRRGKTEEVIEFLQHLPYLRAPGPNQRWLIGPGTIEIAYCDGEVYEEWIDDVQPIPGHCIWLTDHDSRNGLSLLLDAKTGTITEFAIIFNKIMLDNEEYEKLSLQDKWMAHATMPATAFFELWKQNFEKLIWIAIYCPWGAANTVEWYMYNDEKEMPESDDDYDSAEDDDYDPDGEKIEDIDEDGGESGSEDGMNMEDEQILEEEVDELMGDAGQDFHQRRMELRCQQNLPVEIEPTNVPLSTPPPPRPEHQVNRERKRDVSPLLSGR